MAPTSNRPLFSNIFSAFRTHSTFQKAAPAVMSTPGAITAQQSSSPHLPTPTHPPSPSPSQARPIVTKATHQATSQAATAVTTHTFQASLSPIPIYRAHTASPPCSAAPSYVPPLSPPPKHGRNGFQRSRTPSQSRCAVPRRSSIDSDGHPWKEAFPGQSWYIGGRTSGGDERFYKLGMVKRYTSQDRLSLDRMSL